MQLPAVLLADYNAYRRQTKQAWQLEKQGIPFRAKRMDRKTEALLAEMVAWCRERHVEPRLWLFGLFKLRGWTYPPQLKATHLCSENMLKKFGRLKGLGFFSRRRRAVKVTAEADHVFDPNRDIDSTAEGLKRRYADTGQHGLCMERTMTQTLGYHPRSAVCQSCPVAQRCIIELQSRLPFNILGLRLGRMTVADCHEAADAARRAFNE